MYDYLVVGAGLFGAVFAHEAKKRSNSVLVIDNREHIGGNCYTEKREGIDVHVYGPHIFHTSDERIWKFVNQFVTFENFVLSPKVNYRGKIFSFPVNLMTLHQLWGVNTPEEASRKLAEVRVPCENPRNLEEWILSQVGQEVYETFIYGYTKKQWMREPSDLPSSIIKRLPIRLTYDDNYFNHRFQGMPKNGYTEIVEKILDHPNIQVSLGTTFESVDRSEYQHIFYSGPLDRYFQYAHGRLGYRTLEFREIRATGDYQGTAVMNYSDLDVPYTRITEHKYFTPWETHEDTVCFEEHSSLAGENDIPYYPIRLVNEKALLDQYQALASQEVQVTFVGRLGTYRYLDMDVTIREALDLAKAHLAVLGKIGL